ncbi:hypothetical protein [Streptomyces sp. G7(2002)]|uniref:hypothetical protein n=1 Tax=Streptomyces sp. G7(2002) TaxID=2971798 RepID=UPI00237E7CF3|nr:hypothetical protein [Streptomyces sp. G7(2002)]WDT53518.1 hypothetical protein NUT86_05365 [Streptomyces sp. G7(2002)]
MTSTGYTPATAAYTRYEPTQTETVLARLCSRSRPQKTGADLQALRQAGLAAAISRNPRPRIGIYTMVRAGQDPAVRLSVARGLAVRNNWPVEQCPKVDFTGMTDPATRPQLARLLDAVERGGIAGIAAMSRTDFTNLNDYYEDLLQQVHVRGGFLALATPETDI